MLFPEETQEKIADVAKWMDATRVPLGTETGHAKSAVRAILGLARITGGDMARVEEILTDHLAQAWRTTESREDTRMIPLFTEPEIPRPARVA